MKKPKFVYLFDETHTLVNKGNEDIPYIESETYKKFKDRLYIILELPVICGVITFSRFTFHVLESEYGDYLIEGEPLC